MANQQIYRGATPNDNTGDNLREGARKINENFNELYKWLGGNGSTIAAGQKGDLTLGQLADTDAMNAGGTNQLTKSKGFPHEQILQWNGSSWTPTDKLSGNVVGHLIPESGNTYNIGAIGHELNDLWIGANTYFQPDALRLFSDPATPGARRLKLQTSEDRTFTVLSDVTTLQTAPGSWGLRTQGTDSITLDQANCVATTIGATTFYSLPGLDLTSGPLWKFLGNIVPALTLNGNTYPYQADPALRGGANPHCWYISAINQITLANGTPAPGQLAKITDELTFNGTHALLVETEAIEGIGEVVVNNLSQELKNKTIIAANNNIVMNIDDLHDVDTVSNVAWQGASLMYDANTKLWAPGNAATGGGIAGTVTGDLIPGTSNVFSLGTATKRFTDLWLTASTLHIGDVAISDGGGGISINKPMISPSERTIFKHRYSGWAQGNIDTSTLILNGEQYITLEDFNLGKDPSDPAAPGTELKSTVLGGNTYYAMPGVDGTSGLVGPYDLMNNYECTITLGNSTWSRTMTYVNDARPGGAFANSLSHTDGPVWTSNDICAIKLGVNSTLLTDLTNCTWVEYEMKETYPKSGGEQITAEGEQTLENKKFKGTTVFEGDLVPEVDEGYSLGTPTKKWKELYVSGSTIHFGDASISATKEGIELSAPIAKVRDKTLAQESYVSMGGRGDFNLGLNGGISAISPDLEEFKQTDMQSDYLPKEIDGKKVDAYVDITRRLLDAPPATRTPEIVYEKKFGLCPGYWKGAQDDLERTMIGNARKFKGDLALADPRQGDIYFTASYNRKNRGKPDAGRDSNTGENLNQYQMWLSTYFERHKVPGLKSQVSAKVLESKGHSTLTNEAGYLYELEIYEVPFQFVGSLISFREGMNAYRGDWRKYVQQSDYDFFSPKLVAKCNFMENGSFAADLAAPQDFTNLGGNLDNMFWFENPNQITFRDGRSGNINDFFDRYTPTFDPNTKIGTILEARLKVKLFDTIDPIRLPVYDTPSYHLQQECMSNPAKANTYPELSHGWFLNYSDSQAAGVPFSLGFNVKHNVIAPRDGFNTDRSQSDPFWSSYAWHQEGAAYGASYRRGGSYTDPCANFDFRINLVDPKSQGEPVTTDGVQTLKSKTFTGTIGMEDSKLIPLNGNTAIGTSADRFGNIFCQAIDARVLVTYNAETSKPKILQHYELNNLSYLVPQSVWDAKYQHMAKNGESGPPQSTDGRGAQNMMYYDGTYLYICTGPAASDSTKWAWIRTSMSASW